VAALAGVSFVRQVSGERVAVFVDRQNLYTGARDAFHDDRAPGRLGMVDPVRLGRRLIQMSHERDRELIDVRVYRGRPDPNRDPRGYAANRRQQAVVGLGGNRGPRAEVAAWTSSRAAPRLRVTQARSWCHYLRVDDYRGMVDPTDYTSR
jgi:hypothetical protein